MKDCWKIPNYLQFQRYSALTATIPVYILWQVTRHTLWPWKGRVTQLLGCQITVHSSFSLSKERKTSFSCRSCSWWSGTFGNDPILSFFLEELTTHLCWWRVIRYQSCTEYTGKQSSVCLVVISSLVMSLCLLMTYCATLRYTILNLWIFSWV